MTQQEMVASIFDVNLVARTAALIVLTVLAILLAFVPTAQAQTYTVLHAFSGQDGSDPQASLTLDRVGNIYGTASQGGAYDDGGTAFKLSRRNGAWVLSVLYNFFRTVSDGASPHALVLAPDGTLVGSTRSGGGIGLGTLFALRPPATVCASFSCPWQESFVYRFQGHSDGCSPNDLVSDSTGNIYGTTQDSAATGPCEDWGTVYQLTPSGGSWTKTILYTFDGRDGAAPWSALAIDPSGTLYGTTLFTSGSGISYFGYGTVYQLVHTGSDWIHTTIYTFPSQAVGDYPRGVILDPSGNLDGGTSGGGAHNAGTVFQLVPGAGAWTFNSILDFSGGAICGPPAPLTADSAGNLYGVTQCDGALGYGTVFKLTPAAGGWNYIELHTFQGGPDGAYPLASVVLDANGNIYGTTASGGNLSACPNGGCGTVWEITP